MWEIQHKEELLHQCTKDTYIQTTLKVQAHVNEKMMN